MVEVQWKRGPGGRPSAHNFGELGAILAEVILCRGPSSEHNFGESGAILTEVILRRGPSSEHIFGELGAILAEVMPAEEWSGSRFGERFW